MFLLSIAIFILTAIFKMLWAVATLTPCGFFIFMQYVEICFFVAIPQFIQVKEKKLKFPRMLDKKRSRAKALLRFHRTF